MSDRSTDAILAGIAIQHRMAVYDDIGNAEPNEGG
jgi:hypothetical protein